MDRAPKIAKAKGRPVTEWSSDNPETMPPPRVRLRILRRYENKCGLTGIIIADGQQFDLDHVKPLEEGGEHTESNLMPVLRLPHEIKTAAEKKRQAKADRQAKAAHRMKPEGANKIESKGFDRFAKAPKAGAERIDKSAVSSLGPSNIARRFATKGTENV